jgi:DNA modification methylase
MTDLLPGFGMPGDHRVNQLLYGDNLTIMRNMPSASVDLIYLDPPFNSQRSYNLIYKQMTGLPVPEQEEAFCDAWELDPEKEEMARNMPIVLKQQYGADDGLIDFWKAWINALRNTQPRLLAYLVYMSYRLFEMRRLLKPNGTLYLHCDTNASHYIKVVLDGVFGHRNFRNEVVWRRSHPKGNASRRFARNHDVILSFAKDGQKVKWNPLYRSHDTSRAAAQYSLVNETGRRYQLTSLLNPNPDRPNLTYEFKGVTKVWRWTRERMLEEDAKGLIVVPKGGKGIPRYKRYLDEQEGVPIDDFWGDIEMVSKPERLGYPTQKPIALLERIISASSDEGDVVFDPFCGCGTAVYAAHVKKRQWIGCDIAILSVRLVRDILLKRYGLRENVDYAVDGVPKSVDSAQYLFEHDKRQFQHWAVELAGGFCSTKTSGDRGIDGRLYFETSKGLLGMVLSVKGGHITPANVRELRGVLGREDAELAGFICMEKPTRGMLQEAADAGMYTYLGRSYPRLQIRTVHELLEKQSFETPSRAQALDWERQGVLPLVDSHPARHGPRAAASRLRPAASPRVRAS